MYRYRRYGKFNNRKTIVDGITFDSKSEAAYYCRLKLLKAAGKIKSFDIQPKFELIPANKKFRGIFYVADFLVRYPDGKEEVVDVKGFITKDFRIKQKLLYHFKGKEIVLYGGKQRTK